MPTQQHCHDIRPLPSSGMWASIQRLQNAVEGSKKPRGGTSRGGPARYSHSMRLVCDYVSSLKWPPHPQPHTIGKSQTQASSGKTFLALTWLRCLSCLKLSLSCLKYHFRQLSQLSQVKARSVFPNVPCSSMHLERWVMGNAANNPTNFMLHFGSTMTQTCLMQRILS